MGCGCCGYRVLGEGERAHGERVALEFVQQFLRLQVKDGHDAICCSAGDLAAVRTDGHTHGELAACLERVLFLPTLDVP